MIETFLGIRLGWEGAQRQRRGRAQAVDFDFALKLDRRDDLRGRTREDTAEPLGLGKGVVLRHMPRALVSGGAGVVEDGAAGAENVALELPPRQPGKVATDQRRVL